MEYIELVDRLDGLFAYDSGCVSSGIKDDEFKEKLKNDRDLTSGLLNELAKQYINGEYTLEDVNELIKWAERELDFYY